MIATCRDCGAEFSRDPAETWKSRCLTCWAIRRKENYAPRSTPAVVEPLVAELQQNMRGLLSLCHPDRHSNSALSTRVTQWLLTLRRRIEREDLPA